jgi:hypothetical protein
MTQPGLFDVLPKGKPEPQVVAEKKRCATNYDKVLARLRQGPATNVELNAICFRYGGRLHEMRENGLTILTQRHHNGIYVYTLKEQP